MEGPHATLKFGKMQVKSSPFRPILKYLINGLCLGFVIWQIIECITKYIEKPQGTDVRQKKASELPFPAVTVCGDFGKDAYNSIYYNGFNNTYLLDTCGYFNLIFCNIITNKRLIYNYLIEMHKPFLL